MFSYWAYIGSLYLIFCLYSVIKKKPINLKYHYMMYGVTISLISHKNPGLLYILGVLVVIVFLTFLFGKIKLLEDKDINQTFLWVIMGYLIIGYPVILFIPAFIILSYLWKLLKKLTKKEASAYPVLIASFIVTNILMGLY